MRISDWSADVCSSELDSMAEGWVQILTQLTEDLVWQPRWMTHENGIVALRDVVILPTDLEEAADRYARFTEAPPVRLGPDIIRLTQIGSASWRERVW